MIPPQNTHEIIERITSGWGTRDVYHLEEGDLDLLLLQDGAETSTKGNDDGTVTVTVRLQNKIFICTKQAISTK